jgi:hypothetical protein
MVAFEALGTAWLFQFAGSFQLPPRLFVQMLAGAAKAET